MSNASNNLREAILRWLNYAKVKKLQLSINDEKKRLLITNLKGFIKNCKH